MRFCVTGLLAAAIMLGSIGCVAQGTVDEQQELLRNRNQTISDLRGQIEDLKTQIDAIKDDSAGSDARIAELESQLQQRQSELEQLRSALDAAERQLADAGTGQMQIPESVSADLARLAEQYPNLMTYNEELGMIKLKSDMTFALGSANVKEPALNSLRRLAQVLNSQAAQRFEIRVVGHTDTVPIQNPATLRNHPSNWHLSAHRAIAVKDALVDSGVSSRRMNVSGYGPYRPVVPNTNDGAEANRRVEIYLVPMTGRDRQMMERLDNDNGASNAGGDEQPAPRKGGTGQNTGDGGQNVEKGGNGGGEDPALYK